MSPIVIYVCNAQRPRVPDSWLNPPLVVVVVIVVLPSAA